MAFARQFGQAQAAASPWSSGAPPGLQQQQSQQVGQPVQPMFNQPMGAFDISGANWQGQQQAAAAAAAAAAAQQWVAPMQQVQFVPNPAFLQQQHQHHQQQQQQQMQHNQRPMHQRSLSAPRAGQLAMKRPMNQTNFGGPQQHHNNWGQNRLQQANSNNNHQFQNRAGRQQSRMNNHKGQFNNNSQNNGHNNQQQNKNQQNQQQRQQSSQQQQQSNNNKQPVRKVTKVKKLNAIKAKQQTNDVGGSASTADAKAAPDSQGKTQSKTAERKQLKLQARKNAEALKQSKLPVAKATKGANADQSDAADSKVDEPIDQAQLKCVPAVFGFVCKLCDVFLRDKVARREHIDCDEHMEKFRAFEEEQQKALAEKEKDETMKDETSDLKPEASEIKVEDVTVKVEAADEKVSPDETVDEKVSADQQMTSEDKVSSDDVISSDDKVNSDETPDEKVSSNETNS